MSEIAYCVAAVKHRWGVYLIIALAASLVALIWVGDGQNGERAVPSGQPVQREAHTAQTTIDVADAIETDKLTGRPLPALDKNPFSARLWALIQPAGVRNASPPQPQAPPLPFVYVGKLAMNGGTMAVLVMQDRNYVVRAGDTLDGIYGVEAIDDQRVVLTYLPLGVQQTLSFAASGSPVDGVSVSNALIGLRPGIAGSVLAAPITVRPGIDPVLAPPHPDPALAEEE